MNTCSKCGFASNYMTRCPNDDNALSHALDECPVFGDRTCEICEANEALKAGGLEIRTFSEATGITTTFDDLHNHRCSMDHPPCPACELLEEREHEREAGL